MTTPEPSAEIVDPRELADLAEQVGRKAANLLLDGLTRERTSVSTKSTGTDMVTEIDRASEQLIVDALLAARPDDGILGEEGASRPGTSGIRWVIDPLDGTTNYLYRHPGFSVAIAAERIDPTTLDDGVLRGDLLAGVVIDPLLDDVFGAAVGHGSTRNGRPISCSSVSELGQALLATGFAYDPDRRARQAQVIAGLISRVRDIRRVGSAALDLCSVACGRVDAYAELGLAPWDMAAGTLIAREAGALVQNLHGGPPSSLSVVAAPPALMTPLVDGLLAAGADRA
ncbi:MAG: inositol monophosphatase family protein [Acidimicrobiales bacterium]